jgi:O-acetyl-ADP-ribose deacetylase (regulator of RNase III)
MHTDIFESFERSQNAILLHGCNCQGRFGAGFAGQVKDRYPSAYEVYRSYWSRSSGAVLGTIAVCDLGNNKFIYNGFTQMFYGRNKDVVYVSYSALTSVFREASDAAIRLDATLMFPFIGAGLGGGDPERIKQIMKDTIDRSVNAYLFLPTAT